MFESIVMIFYLYVNTFIWFKWKKYIWEVNGPEFFPWSTGNRSIRSVLLSKAVGHEQ